MAEKETSQDVPDFLSAQEDPEKISKIQIKKNINNRYFWMRLIIYKLWQKKNYYMKISI